MGAQTNPAAVNCCAFVNVPGQKAWHTHLCEKCGTSWTHIAPTPMTQRQNRQIHTCHKCGTMVYKFVAMYDGPVVPEAAAAPLPTLAMALIGGLIVGGGLVALFDRRQ